MAKNPAFQFYPRDWLSDTELQQASASTRGIWINLLSHMWFSQERGSVSGTVQELCRLAACTEHEWLIFYHENQRLNFAEVSLRDTKVTGGDFLVTVINRRMIRDEKSRISHAYRQKKYRYGHSDSKVTPPSPSPSPSPTPNTKEKKKEKTPPAPPSECSVLLNFWSDLYLERNGQRPEVEGKRDMMSSKALLSGRTLDQAKAIVTHHFDHPSQFYAENHLYGIHHIRKDCNQIISRMQGGISKVHTTDKTSGNLAAAQSFLRAGETDVGKGSHTVCGTDGATRGSIPAKTIRLAT